MTVAAPNTTRHVLNIPVNRTEGDLEVRVAIEDGKVAEAWSVGTMYRGFENILVGRAPMDALVITPRICGLCSVAHLSASALGLDAIAKVETPDNAIRLRNVTLMVENVQSDIRHAFLLFAVDFCNTAYARHSMYAEALRRYEPLKGSMAVETLRETKKILEIVALLGGQWPHSSYMVPGGVVSIPPPTDLLQCLRLFAEYREWYERRVLGCAIGRWREVKSAKDLDAWLAESASHRESELGFYIRFAREAGLDRIGKGHGNFVSLGAHEMPRDTAAKPLTSGARLVPAGFAVSREVHAFDQSRVSEHVAYSWFRDYEGGLHPFEGKTQPYATGSESKKYSWAKAVRYDNRPAETGPLAEAIISRDPLFGDLVRANGPNVFIRELARLVRPAVVMPTIEVWLTEMAKKEGKFYRLVEEVGDGRGAGLVDVARGALGHWITVEGGKISRYQIITPTAWNASPRDSAGVRGPWEEALVGTPIRDADNPVEVGHVIRSFDACMVCCVHTFRGGRPHGKVTV